MLFPTITSDHWRAMLALARATTNAVSEQIKQLCRGESQAALSIQDATCSSDLPASPARNNLPAVVGVLTADVLGSAAGGGHHFMRGGEAGAVACTANREPVAHAPESRPPKVEGVGSSLCGCLFFTHGSGVARRVSPSQIRRETDQH